MQETQNRWALAALLAALLAVVFIALWRACSESLDSPVRAPQAPESIQHEAMEGSDDQADASPAAEEGIVRPPTEFSASVDLSPWEVIGNIECTMTVGRGPAVDSAIVVVPVADGARFSALGSDGTMVSGSIPFRPHIVELGIRPDGTPVIGLGDLRRNSDRWRDIDSPEPLRIIVGDQTVYQSDKVWDFVVASDGSSYAVQEPLAGGGSRLVVENLHTGAQSHFDLGTNLTPVDAYERSHLMRYSQDQSEIVFMPSHSDAMGLGTYWFYPTREGATRRIQIEQYTSAVLVSSSEGYFVDQPADLKEEERRGVWRVTRRQFDAGNGSVDEVWR